MKCKGHIHIGHNMRLCHEEMDWVGFAKDRATELYICRNKECSRHKEIQTVITEEENT